MWDFSTETTFQRELDWVDEFVRERVEPLDHVLGSQWDIHAEGFKAHVRPLQREVQERGLWACHLGPELGGRGYGQLKLALLNEKLGMSRFGPITFGIQAPDTGNAEILARYGTPEQQQQYLEPLLANATVSCFAMTEPQGGADPTMIASTAVREDDEWVIDGEKWFASMARYAAFHLMLLRTDPDADSPYRQMSVFIVPADTPGIEVVRDYGFYGEVGDDHAHLRLTGVRVPAENLLGPRGEGFAVAQDRLGGGRLHHAMRAVAQASRALEMMSQRAVSRTTKGELLGKKQMVQEMIADSWVQLRQFRLLVLETAWLADQGRDWREIRMHVSAVKSVMPKVLHDIAARALQIHGALGLSHQMPFAAWVVNSFHIGLADGPTEVHKQVVAKELLRDVEPAEGVFPDHIGYRVRERAEEMYPPVDEA